jgi:hypothetical protein
MRNDDGRKLDHKALEQLRIRAVRQIEQGAILKTSPSGWG